MPIDPGFAIGLAAGIALLGLFLGITYIFFLRRSREARRAHAKAHPLDVEKRPSFPKRKRSARLAPHETPAPPRSRAHPDALTHIEHPDELACDPYTPPPKPHPRTRRSMRTGTCSPLAPRAQQRGRLAVPTRVARGVSGDTAASASMYSAASAPRELHELLAGARSFSRAYGYVYAHAHAPSPLGRARAGGGSGASGPKAAASESAHRAYPGQLPPTPLDLNLVDALRAQEEYEATLAHRLGGAEAHMPRRPQPASTPEMSARKQSRFRVSRLDMPPTPMLLLPGYASPNADPPSPLAKKSRQILFCEAAEATMLPSPHSPAPKF